MASTESVPNLTATGAWCAIDRAMAMAVDLGVAIVVAVVDRGGNPLAMLRMDGAPLFSVEVAEKKAWTAVAGRTRTDRLRGAFMSDPVLVHALAPKIERFLAVGGGAPVMVDGLLAGAIGVSGATEAQDQQIADHAAASID